MRPRLLPAAGILLVTSLAFPACDPAEQYGNTTVESLKTTQRVADRVDLQTAQRSIGEFQAANGRYPADLSELAAFNGMALGSDQFDYDPETGSLTRKE